MSSRKHFPFILQVTYKRKIGETKKKYSKFKGILEAITSKSFSYKTLETMGEIVAREFVTVSYSYALNALFCKSFSKS